MSRAVGADVRIGLLSVTLPAGTDRVRMDAALRRVAGTGLDSALAALGLPDGEWCVRRLDVPARLNLEHSAERVAEEWASVLAFALRQMLVGTGENVLRYESVRGAATDLISSVATGRWDRAWAWRQLGVLRPGANSPAAAIAGALAVIGDDALGALVTAVEAAGVAALHRALGPAGWAAVADVATGTPSAFGHGDDGGTANLSRTVTATSTGDSGSPATARPDRAGSDRSAKAGPATDLLRRSRFAAAVAKSGVRPDPATAAAWARIIAVEADPVILRRADHAEVVGAIAFVLEQLAESSSRAEERPESSKSSGPLEEPPSRGEGPVAATTAAPTGGGDDAWRLKPSPAELPGSGISEIEEISGPRVAEASADGLSWPSGGAVSESATALDRGSDQAHPARGSDQAQSERRSGLAQPRRGSDRTQAARSSDRAPAAARKVGPSTENGQPRPARPTAPAVDVGGAPDGRVGVPTAWGGLLFLLNTASEAGLPDAAFRPTLTGRSIRWIVHELATRLAPLSPDDPAALALCGLTPHDQPPSEIGEKATARERRALQRIADRWIMKTAALLPADGDAARVVGELARRPAVIVADPGWIEIRLPLDSVRLDVRRAGLDLDPGWVPWLRTVIRFVYRGGDDG
ncbi:hypothetical protein [Actinoplanes sp. HUAS TT8]|uniref:hypothetical protein n=1 Tax=Actinoplanes sp. HUAS TT8 TaxID=3447453 RepID=UPI003F521C02